MVDSLITVLILALAASFLPLQFGAEISLLGSDGGPKKVSSLITGITLMRILVAVIIVVVFAGATAALTEGIQNIGGFISTTLHNLGRDIGSGQHVLLDILLIAAGVVLIIHAIRMLRDGPEDNEPSEKDAKKMHDTGVVSMIIFGLLWASVSVNQWIFTATAVGHILALPVGRFVRIIVFILFLLLASLLIVMPLLLILLRPNTAQASCEKINGWLNGALRYVVIVGFFVIGLYLLWKGAGGFVNFLNT